jgi:ubiquinone/menaquinone biosynthesis C-methylase UbiE
MHQELPSHHYSRDYLMSDLLEGYGDFEKGELSATKTKEMNLLDLFPGARILDVGFGRGELLYHCAKEKGAVVAGIDYSEAAYEIAKKTLADVPGADVRRADCRELPFEDESFDRVVSGDVIEHLCFEDGVRMLKEIRRVLKPGGLMIIHTTPNTLFKKIAYPAVRPILKVLNAKAVEHMQTHLYGTGEVFLHLHEFNLFTLRKIARVAGLDGAKAWIDPDVLRSGKHRITREFASNPLVAIAAWCARFAPVRLVLGNDLYLRYTKK